MKELLLLALTITCALAAATPCNGTHPYTLGGLCYLRTHSMIKNAHGKRLRSTSATIRHLPAKVVVRLLILHLMATTAAYRHVHLPPT